METIFTHTDKAEMLWSARIIGLAASKVKCEQCGKYRDTISPCALCLATRAFPTYRI